MIALKPEIGFLDRRVVEQLCRWAGLNNPAVLHHIRDIGELETGTHVLLDDEHGHVRCALRSGDSASECPELKVKPA